MDNKTAFGSCLITEKEGAGGFQMLFKGFLGRLNT